MVMMIMFSCWQHDLQCVG